MEGILNSIAGFFAGLTLALGVSSSAVPTPTPTPSYEPVREMPKQYSTYKGSYNHLGSVSSVTFQLPEGEDGPFFGSISGACNGAIVGRVTGDKLDGKGVGTCKIAGADVKAEATFTGFTNDRKLVASFDGKAGIFSLKDNMVLVK